MLLVFVWDKTASGTERSNIENGLQSGSAPLLYGTRLPLLGQDYFARTGCPDAQKHYYFVRKSPKPPVPAKPNVLYSRVRFIDIVCWTVG